MESMLNGKFLMFGFAGMTAFALCGQSLGAHPRGVQDAQPIQRVVTANTTETYKSSSKVQQSLDSPFGNIPINISTDETLTLKIGAVDAMGVGAVELTTTVDTLDGGDSQVTAGLTKKKPDPMTQTGTINKLGHLSLKAPQTTDKMAEIFSGITGGLQSSLFIELPDHPVKVGDSWDIVIPKGEFTGPEDQKITAKLTGDKTVEGKDAWTVDVSGTVNIVFDSASLGPPDPNATGMLAKFHILAKGTTVLKGTGLVEKSTGKTLSLDATSDLKTNIELPDEGDLTAQGAGTLVTSLKLQK
jgi:hypothetical protein